MIVVRRTSFYTYLVLILLIPSLANAVSCYKFNYNLPLNTYRSKDVGMLQNILSAMGYINFNEIDDSYAGGKMDEFTIDAVKSYQADYDLSQTGILDFNTRKKINSQFACTFIPKPKGKNVSQIEMFGKTFKRAYVAKDGATFSDPELYQTEYLLDGEVRDGLTNYSQLVSIIKYKNTNNFNKPDLAKILQDEFYKRLDNVDVVPVRKPEKNPDGSYEYSFLFAPKGQDAYFNVGVIYPQGNVIMSNYVSTNITKDPGLQNASKTFRASLNLNAETWSDSEKIALVNYFKDIDRVLNDKHFQISSEIKNKINILPKDQDIYKTNDYLKDLRIK